MITRKHNKGKGTKRSKNKKTTKRIKSKKTTKRCKKHKNKHKNIKRTRKHKGGGKFDTPRTRPDSVPYSRPTPNQNPPCPYGAACYQKNPAHIAKFTHPCPYGATCFRQKNPAHTAEFSHSCPPGAVCGPIRAPIPHEIRLYTNDEEIEQFLADGYEIFKTSPNNSLFTLNYKGLGMQDYNPANKEEFEDIKKMFYFNVLKYIACHLCDLVKEYPSLYLHNLLQLFEEGAIGGIFDDEDKCLLKYGDTSLSNIGLMAQLRWKTSNFNKMCLDQLSPMNKDPDE